MVDLDDAAQIVQVHATINEKPTLGLRMLQRKAKLWDTSKEKLQDILNVCSSIAADAADRSTNDNIDIDKSGHATGMDVSISTDIPTGLDKLDQGIQVAFEPDITPETAKDHADVDMSDQLEEGELQSQSGSQSAIVQNTPEMVDLSQLSDALRKSAAKKGITLSKHITVDRATSPAPHPEDATQLELQRAERSQLMRKLASLTHTKYLSFSIRDLDAASHSLPPIELLPPPTQAATIIANGTHAHDKPNGDINKPEAKESPKKQSTNVNGHQRHPSLPQKVSQDVPSTVHLQHPLPARPQFTPASISSGPAPSVSQTVDPVSVHIEHVQQRPVDPRRARRQAQMAAQSPIEGLASQSPVAVSAPASSTSDAVADSSRSHIATTSQLSQRLLSGDMNRRPDESTSASSSARASPAYVARPRSLTPEPPPQPPERQPPRPSIFDIVPDYLKNKKKAVLPTLADLSAPAGVVLKAVADEVTKQVDSAVDAIIDRRPLPGEANKTATDTTSGPAGNASGEQVRHTDPEMDMEIDMDMSTAPDGLDEEPLPEETAAATAVEQTRLKPLAPATLRTMFVEKRKPNKIPARAGSSSNNSHIAALYSNNPVPVTGKQAKDIDRQRAAEFARAAEEAERARCALAGQSIAAHKAAVAAEKAARQQATRSASVTDTSTGEIRNDASASRTNEDPVTIVYEPLDDSEDSDGDVPLVPGLQAQHDARSTSDTVANLKRSREEADSISAESGSRKKSNISRSTSDTEYAMFATMDVDDDVDETTFPKRRKRTMVPEVVILFKALSSPPIVSDNGSGGLSVPLVPRALPLVKTQAAGSRTSIHSIADQVEEDARDNAAIIQSSDKDIDHREPPIPPAEQAPRSDQQGVDSTGDNGQQSDETPAAMTQVEHTDTVPLPTSYTHEIGTNEPGQLVHDEVPVSVTMQETSSTADDAQSEQREEQAVPNENADHLQDGSREHLPEAVASTPTLPQDPPELEETSPDEQSVPPTAVEEQEEVNIASSVSPVAQQHANDIDDELERHIALLSNRPATTPDEILMHSESIELPSFAGASHSRHAFTSIIDDLDELESSDDDDDLLAPPVRLSTNSVDADHHGEDLAEAADASGNATDGHLETVSLKTTIVSDSSSINEDTAPVSVDDNRHTDQVAALPSQNSAKGASPPAASNAWLGVDADASSSVSSSQSEGKSQSSLLGGLYNRMFSR
ncbi:hypothetical protein EMMF5_000872 [Cystobasidiomycetes sp. EMM_F5]